MGGLLGGLGEGLESFLTPAYTHQGLPYPAARIKQGRAFRVGGSRTPEQVSASFFLHYPPTSIPHLQKSAHEGLWACLRVKGVGRLRGNSLAAQECRASRSAVRLRSLAQPRTAPRQLTPREQKRPLPPAALRNLPSYFLSLEVRPPKLASPTRHPISPPQGCLSPFSFLLPAPDPISLP